MKFLVVSLLFSINVFARSAQIVADPYKYAETVTTVYAEDSSDTTPYGFNSCAFLRENARTLEINCAGFKTFLVFGGHPATGNFECEFKFNKLPNRKFAVISQECD